MPPGTKMAQMEHVIWLDASAPPKPAPGAACNGCGVCCAAGPCPVGIVVSRRWRGACAALRWEQAARRYVCGVATATAHGRLRKLPFVAAAARRLIAAGNGCDCTLEAVTGTARGRPVVSERPER